MNQINHRTKPARLADVAHAAGVSISAAGTVLNIRSKPSRVSPAVAEHIREVAARLNYIPNYHARSVRSGRAQTIAVALDCEFAEGPFVPYWAHLLGAIDAHCRLHDFQMTIVGPAQAQSAVDRALLGMQQKRFDGMIIFGSVLNPAKKSILSDPPPNMPIVVIQPQQPTRLFSIDFDSVTGITMAVDYLVSLGHRSLLWVGPDAPGLAAVRRQAFERAATKRKATFRTLTFSADFKPPTEAPAPAANRFAMVDPIHRSVVATLLPELNSGRPRPTGVVCYNDDAAIGVYAALNQAGIRVPRDMSIVGFDDTLAYLCIPPMTTISHEFVAMGLEAAKSVLEMIREPKSRRRFFGTSHMVKARLVVRASTAPPPG